MKKKERSERPWIKGLDTIACRCGYTWVPRTNNPKACPSCKTRLDAKVRA